MYDKKLETVRGLKAVYDERQKALAAERLQKVAEKKRKKRLAKKEAQA